MNEQPPPRVMSGCSHAAKADNKTDVTLRMRLGAGASKGIEDMQMAQDDKDASPAVPH